MKLSRLPIFQRISEVYNGIVKDLSGANLPEKISGAAGENLKEAIEKN